MKDVTIYKITNIINNRVYIGQTVNYNTRVGQHKRCSCNNDMMNIPLYYDMNNYGIDNFKFEILEIVDSSISDDKEIYYIELYESSIDLGGYNLDLDGKRGRHSNYTKDRISNAHKGFGGASVGKFGSDSYRAVKILCLNNSKIYGSIVECAEELFGDRNLSNKISSVANPKSNKFTYKGYEFRYLDSNGNIIEKEVTPLSRGKYNKGMRIKELNSNLEFNSISEASQHFNISSGMIRDRVHGRVKCDKWNFKILE